MYPLVPEFPHSSSDRLYAVLPRTRPFEDIRSDSLVDRRIDRPSTRLIERRSRDRGESFSREKCVIDDNADNGEGG